MFDYTRLFDIFKYTGLVREQGPSGKHLNSMQVHSPP